MRVRYFAINVKSNTFRRDRIHQQCAKFSIPLEIFEAITPDTISQVPNSYDPERTRAHWGRPLMPTELACALSHIQLWRNLLQDETVDAYVIMEDDVTLEASIPSLLDAINIPDNVLLKMSGQHDRPSRLLFQLPSGQKVYKMAYGPLDASAYLVSKKNVAQLLAYCEKLHCAIDVMMDRSYEHGVEIWSIQPYPAISLNCTDENNPLFSDIGNRYWKYDQDTTFFQKYVTRFLRMKSSLAKRWAEVRLKIWG
jgi:glycosyl transferase family 25